MRRAIILACLTIAFIQHPAKNNDVGDQGQQNTQKAQDKRGAPAPSQPSANATNQKPAGDASQSKDIEVKVTSLPSEISIKAIKDSIDWTILGCTIILTGVGIIGTCAAIKTLKAINRQAAYMLVHARHFNRLAQATATQVTLMEAQFDQSAALTNWRTWKHPRNGKLRVTVDLVDLSEFPITFSDGYLKLAQIGITAQYRYSLGESTFLSPRFPKLIECDVILTEAEQAAYSVKFQVDGVFSHRHRISKKLITQRICGVLDCSRWSSDKEWHAMFTDIIYMTPETEAPKEGQNPN
jgi:hypothetical protein